MTSDFLRIMEEASGKDLKLFFKQWLYQPGLPKISGNWRYDAKSKSVNLEIQQAQAGLFHFPLEINFVGRDGQKETKTIQVASKAQKIAIPMGFEVQSVVLDPNTWLLFEGSLSQK